MERLLLLNSLPLVRIPVNQTRTPIFAVLRY